jgi:hypothetical protein
VNKVGNCSSTCHFSLGSCFDTTIEETYGGNYITEFEAVTCWSTLPVHYFELDILDIFGTFAGIPQKISEGALCSSHRINGTTIIWGRLNTFDRVPP